MKYMPLLLLVVGLSTPMIVYGEKCSGDARATLNSYLALDADGARLQGWQSDKYLMNPDGEPGWDMADAITSYEIVKERCNNNRCRFEVKYDLAPMSGKQNVEDHPDGGTEIEVYYLYCMKGKWLIDGYVLPHVMQDKLQKHLREIRGGR